MKTIFSILVFWFCAQVCPAQNLLDLSSWKIGTGTAGQFYQNGQTSENSRVWGIGPDGKSAILWRAQPEGQVNDDGGWNAYISVEHTSAYRLSVWIKKTGVISGSTYFGTNNVNALDNSPQSNPYFWSGQLPQLNKWYLLVAYVHGSGDNSTVNLGGIYDGVTGEKAHSITDFKLDVSTTAITHRAYLFYDPSTGNEQFFYAPRLERIDGQEPAINSLLGFQNIPKQVDLPIPDTRYNATTPNSYSQSFQLNFKQGSVLGLPITYYTTMGLRGWSENSGGKAHELAFSNDTKSKILFRSGLSPSWEGWRSLLISDENGNYGIGTDNPDEKLTVNGKIHAKEIRVDATMVPDYVFEDDYKLLSLNEIETFIKKNKHLPEVPSAAEAAKNGLELGEMNKILLKKIEELTLYVIDLQKQVKLLQQSNKK
jgi:hypothetical protein